MSKVSVDDWFHMKLRLQHLENILVIIFFLVLPLQRHHIFFKFGYEFGDFSAVSIYVSDLLAFALIILAFFKGNFIKKLAQNKLFLILAIFLVFEAFFLPHETYPAFFKNKMAELVLIFAYFGISDVSYATIFKSITISGLFQGLLAIIQFIKQKSLGLHFLGEQVLSSKLPGVAKIQSSIGTLIRPYGTFAHPNQLAAFLVVACATCLALIALEKGTYTRLFYMVSLILLILAETLTFSRAGWIGALIILAFFMFLPRETLEKSSYRRIVLLIFMAIIFSLIVAQPYLSSRLTLTDQATFNRLYYDRAGITAFLKYPILGSGLGQLMPTMSKVETYKYLWQIQPPHNYFIDVACETGFIGLAVMVYFFAKLLIELWRSLKIGENREKIFKITLFSIFVSILVLMQFDHYFYTLQQTQLLLWSILGIIYRTVYHETRAYS